MNGTTMAHVPRSRIVLPIVSARDNADAADPPDVKHFPQCGKVMGDHKGWFGSQCFCGKPAGDALRDAHGAGNGASKR
jgi:hypothetical protein